MAQRPEVGEKYVHFKGTDKIYEIVGVARDCENPSNEVVIYRQLYPTENFPIGTIWSRSLEDFCGEKELPDESKVKRFRRKTK